MEAAPNDFALPPPPSLFVGRRAALQKLGQQGRAHRVLFIEGAAGTGKSAMVRRWLETSEVSPVCVEIRPGDDITDTLGLVAIALGATPPKRGSPDVYLAVVLERSEALSSVTVIEDLHYWTPDQARWLLDGLARHSRAARWVLTGRQPLPLPTRTGHVFLGPMDRREAQLLAEQAGRPIQSDTVELTPLAILRGTQEVADDDAPLLKQLSMIDLALSVDDLERLGPMTTDEIVPKLTGMGLLVQTPDGYRLHDLIRNSIAASLNDAERHELATSRARCLSDSQRPQATIEALRALTTNGRASEAEVLATQRRSALIRAGQGLRLWRLLSQVESAGLRRQAFDVAVTIATQESLNWLQAQLPPAEPGARLSWLRGLAIAGRRQEAHRGTRELLADADISPETRADATLLLARILLKTGDVHAARRHLAQLETAQPHQRWAGAALDAVASMMAGDLQSALSRARMVRDACATLQPEEALAIRADIEPIWLELGDATDTKGVVDETATASNRQMQVLRAMAMTAKANPAAAKMLIEAMTRNTNASPEERAKVNLAAAGVSVAVGDMAGLARHLEVATSCARESQDWATYQWIMAARASFAWLANWPEPVLPWDESFNPPAGIHELNLRGISHLAALEAGRPSPYTTEELFTEGLSGEFAALMQFAQSVAYAMEGKLDMAATVVERSIARARAGGWVAYELVGLIGSSVIQLIRRDRTALVAAANQLYERAVASGVELARIAAEFVVEAAQTDPQLDILVRIAAGTGQAPRQANWARSLLGLEEPRGKMARLIVDATRDLWDGLRIFHMPAPASTSFGWGVNAAADAMWLPEASETISLRRRPHFRRFIQYLAANGGSATMEQLAVHVWEVGEYHPVNDENRIRVAVGRYRELVEDERDVPRRLITVDGGYAFGTDEPVTVAWR